MNDCPDDEGSEPSGPLYYDPIDKPSPGATLLVTSTDEENKQSWRGNSLVSCLRGYLLYHGDDGSEWIFRRVAEADWPQLKVWELATEQKDEDPFVDPVRLLACYDLHVSYKRTIRISPEVGEPLGIKEIYMHADQHGENYSYLDRTGIVRPIRLIVDGGAVEIDCDDEFRRELIEDAVLNSERERLFSYNEGEATRR